MHIEFVFPTGLQTRGAESVFIEHRHDRRLGEGWILVHLSQTNLKKCSVMENISKANARNQRKWLIYKRCVQIIHHILGGRGPFCYAYIQRDINN